MASDEEMRKARVRDNAPHAARRDEAKRQAGKITVSSERGRSR